MTPELAYFLKINVGIIVFYIFYRLFFYKDTFFHWRRTALLCFLGVSLFYPMLNLQEWVKAHEPMVVIADLYATTLLPEVVFEETITPTHTNWQEFATNSLSIIYFCGVILLFIRFIMQLTSIILLRIQCKVTEIQGVRVQILNKASGPFSFFHWIFVHPESHTQEELADRAELSKGFISQLERDMTSPSIATLEDLLQCLGTTLGEFFNEEQEEEQIVFTEEDFFVKKDEEYKNQIKWIIPNAQKNCMEPIHLLLEKGGETCPDNPHEGEEFGYILKGKVEIHLGKRICIAQKGDAFYYRADKTHYLKGIERTELIWVTSPPSF